MDKERILNIILGEIYNASTEDDILMYDEKRGAFIIGGAIQPPERSQQIIEAANELKNNFLFDLLIKELQYEGTKKMAVQAADWDAVRFPKALLYAANLIQKKVITLSNLSVQKPKAEKKKNAQ